MANDCLVTKLKGVVNNENLETMGVFRMKYYHPTNTSEGRTCLQMFGISEATIVSGDAYFIALDNTTRVESKTITTQDHINVEWYYFNISNNADCILEIKSKYNLGGGIDLTQTNTNAMVEIYEKYYHYIGANRDINITIPVLETYTEDTLNGIFNTIKANTSVFLKADSTFFKNQLLIQESIFNVNPDKITGVSFFSTTVQGSTSDIAKFTNLVSLVLNNTTISRGGLLSDFGKLIRLETLQLAINHKVLGSIEDFVAAQRTNGRTECAQLRMPYLNLSSGITWKGSHTGQQNSVLSWTPTTITLDGDTINA